MLIDFGPSDLRCLAAEAYEEHPDRRPDFDWVGVMEKRHTGILAWRLRGQPRNPKREEATVLWAVL